jgi:hypothetical protein
MSIYVQQFHSTAIMGWRGYQTSALFAAEIHDF